MVSSSSSTPELDLVELFSGHEHLEVGAFDAEQAYGNVGLFLYVFRWMTFERTDVAGVSEGRVTDGANQSGSSQLVC